jgi:hypothetical protein
MATKRKTKKSSKSRKKAPATKVAKRSKKLLKAKTAPTRAKKPKASSKKHSRKKRGLAASQMFSPGGSGRHSGKQSGDLQGLSRFPAADSESVDELLEEGNAFEAEVVKGVEDVPDADEGEVHTHEVPEDDVPEEYLDKDQ